jgi:hypothetical protein
MNIDIYQISSLLSRQQVLTLGLFNNGKNNEDSKYLTFFHLIHSNEVSNDNESILKLNYSNKASFLKFKERYRKKLFDYILLAQARLRFDDNTHESYFELLKLYSVARILHFRNQKKKRSHYI